MVLTDTDFADDIAIITEEIEKSQEMLTSIEFEAAKIGLHLNVKKTEVVHYNQKGITTIKARNGMALKSVENFKYLGGWVKRSEKDIDIRKAFSMASMS